MDLGVVDFHDIVYGDCWPILLGPKEGDRYLVIGQCYVPSVQFGEAVLGCLPADTQPMRGHLDGQPGWTWGFQVLDSATETSKYKHEDPRIKAVLGSLYLDHSPKVLEEREFLDIDLHIWRKARIEVREFTL